MRIRLNKRQLNEITNYLGLAIIITGAATEYKLIPVQHGGFIGAVLGGLVAFFTNMPASATPTTSQVENQNVREG